MGIFDRWKKKRVEETVDINEVLTVTKNEKDDIQEDIDLLSTKLDDVLANIRMIEVPDQTVVKMNGEPRKATILGTELGHVRNIVTPSISGVEQQKDVERADVDRAISHNQEFVSYEEKELNKKAAEVAFAMSEKNSNIDSLTAYDRIVEFVDVCKFISSKKGHTLDYKEFLTVDNLALLDYCTASDEARDDIKRQYGYYDEMNKSGSTK